MHGDPLRPQEGFGGRLQLWASSLLACLLSCTRPGVLAGGGPTAALALSGPGGSQRPWGALTSCTSPSPLQDPCWVYACATAVSRPQDPLGGSGCV